MKPHLLNQLQYSDIPYYTGLKIGGLPEHFNNIARSGCGVCCFIMGVEAITGKRISIEEGIKYAVESGATNNDGGTDLDVLCRFAAPKLGLESSATDDINTMIEWVKGGGAAIANSGGNRDDYICPFSKYGHYIYIVGIEGDRCSIYDPTIKPGKYDEWIEKGVLSIKEDVISLDLEYLDSACNNKSPRYCLIRRDNNV